MDALSTQLLTQFLSLPTLVFTLGLGVVILAVRRFVEGLSARVANSNWWNELLLPCIPVLLGGVIALAATMYPYPEVFAKAASARFFYGVVCGFFSSKLYRIGWALLKKYLQARGIDPNDLKSVRPPGPPPIVGGPK